MKNLSFIKVLYYNIIPSFIFIWISGCSNRINIDRKQGIRNVDYMEVNQFYSTAKFLKEKNGANKSNIKEFVFSNKHRLTRSNRYVYNDINKSSYISYYYKVQPGDTLYYIAWITGNDYCSLAKMNNIGVNEILKIGQVLQVIEKYSFLDKNLSRRSLKNNSVKKNIKMVPCVNSAKTNHVFRSNIRNNFSISRLNVLENKDSVKLLSSSNHSVQKLVIPRSNVSVLSNEGKVFSEILPFDSNNIVKRQSSVFWCWPTIGKVISVFSSSEGGNKGIDISGSVGQSVFSARSGKVVYTGNILFGYGNLIIIKHDNDFLSTYAHNDEILVSEQQNVVLGQKIATMGNSGCNMVKLHFEIRHKGRSVDPLYYLPKK